MPAKTIKAFEAVGLYEANKRGFKDVSEEFEAAGLEGPTWEEFIGETLFPKNFVINQESDHVKVTTRALVKRAIAPEEPKGIALSDKALETLPETLNIAHRAKVYCENEQFYVASPQNTHVQPITPGCALTLYFYNEHFGKEQQSLRVFSEFMYGPEAKKTAEGYITQAKKAIKPLPLKIRKHQGEGYELVPGEP